VSQGIDANAAHRPPPGTTWNAAFYFQLFFEDHILRRAVEPRACY
jgi:hypothetical protein